MSCALAHSSRSIPARDEIGRVSPTSETCGLIGDAIKKTKSPDYGAFRSG